MDRYFKIISVYALTAFFVWQLSGLKDDYINAYRKWHNEIPHNSFDDLAAAVEGKKQLEPARLEAYLKYAQAVLRFNPQRADAWGLSGFCYLEKKEYQRAIFSYIQATSIEPQIFGFHYNLAYAYFQDKQYDLAASSVEKALLCDPRGSLLYVLSASKIYALLLVSRVNLGVPVEQQIKRGYERAYQLMAASQYRLKMAMPFPGEDDLAPEVF